MNRNLIRMIILLPGTVLALVPGVLLWVTQGTSWAAELASVGEWRLWIGLVLGGVGLFLAGWTSHLFLRFGDGTPAPWEPPQKLVVRGPYRHVRNPMISGALLVLLAETLLSGSWALAAWLALFGVFNLLYFPLVEEKELEQRFGADYIEYKANVARWIPRLRPWTKGQS